ncbi:MAG: bifunctional 23S rRNA (guanine(2069)-N(7))-methyltransferase RlmK/23S rRNA (guanine(2445)-N(2))-methyltransferase RlmL [Gammaproteobacteria bacterium]|nr:bifunctional 23S rRNA (guanine(2069)-N(7))-methyltransferase RlmK/23S rRNA (guanine(2445)-N(2))-methyltransferase RlmL [Gammaproteobacteria bacterium]
MSKFSLFVSTPKGVEPAVMRELEQLGVVGARRVAAGALFTGDLSTAYRVCLWSRVASRVYLNLEDFRVRDADEIYEAVKSMPWQDHLRAEGTLAVSFKGMGSGIRHTHFGAQRVKDGVVDHLRELTGARPTVDLERPDVQLSAVLKGERLSIGLDLVGRPLHRRGYRERLVPAPLKENLAAALLLLADWPRLAAEGAPLADPMCGSGTFLIEGAMMAADVAPGLGRERFGFEGWLGHDPEVWSRLCAEAADRRAAGAGRVPGLHGGDSDAAAVEATRINAGRAGFGDDISVSTVAVADFAPAGVGPGLLVTNPPYGHRLHGGDARAVYGELERRLGQRFADWRLAVLYPDEVPATLELGRRCRDWPVYNGALPCRLRSCGPVAAAPPETLGEGATMFANRLRKNARHLARWAARNDIHCYRVYDGDLPEYAFAVDIYGGRERWAHVQEYLPPESVDANQARRRRREAGQVIAEVLEFPRDHVFFKFRERQKGRDQYGRLDRQERLHEVWEGGYRFLVNFTDYLDTGLFLDHRLVRARVGALAAGGRFLNLFAYTGSATVYAAGNGAVETTSVDLSTRYLEWARHNMELNGFWDDRHRFVAADCGAWLEQAREEGARYDVIYVDPPTFSNSKKMAGHWDVQRDHEALLRLAAGLLSPAGVLVFSTNARRFRLSPSLTRDMVCREFTKASLPEDFKRRPRIHQCWEMRGK